MNCQEVGPIVDRHEGRGVADVRRSLLPVDELLQGGLQVVHHQLLLRLGDPSPVLIDPVPNLGQHTWHVDKRGKILWGWKGTCAIYMM